MIWTTLSRQVAKKHGPSRPVFISTHQRNREESALGKLGCPTPEVASSDSSVAPQEFPCWANRRILSRRPCQIPIALEFVEAVESAP